MAEATRALRVAEARISHLTQEVTSLKQVRRASDENVHSPAEAKAASIDVRGLHRAQVEAENRELKAEIAALKKAASKSEVVDKENGLVMQSPARARLAKTRSALSPRPSSIAGVREAAAVF